MNENVQICVKGISEESGVVEINSVGKYALIREVEYVKYDEILEEAEVKISNMIKLRKGGVEIIKKGPMSSHMIFVPKQTTQCIYETPYGSIPMEVHTKSMNVIRTNDRLRIVLEYTLGMGEEQKINSTVDISVESV